MLTAVLSKSLKRRSNNKISQCMAVNDYAASETISFRLDDRDLNPVSPCQQYICKKICVGFTFIIFKM